jgi:hypothetical protein
MRFRPARAGSARLWAAGVSVCLSASLFACLSGGELPAQGANYLAPGSPIRSCTEFTQFDFVGGVEQLSRWFQVFTWTDVSGKARFAEEVYNRLGTAEGYQGSLEFTLDPRVPSEAESLAFSSALYILYDSRYRDLAEVRRSARDSVPLKGLIPPDDSNRIGFAAPFRYGTLELDTAWIIIRADKADSGYAYGMIFRKNGEAALTYRFRKDPAAGDSLQWVIRETRRPCDTLYHEPPDWPQRVLIPGNRRS